MRVFLSQPLLDMFDPFILVCGAEAGGDNGEFSFVVQDSRSLIRQRIADSFWSGLVDKKVTRSATKQSLAYRTNSSYVDHWTVAGTFLSPPAPGFRAVPKPRFGGV